LKALGEEDLSSAGQSNEELPKENIFFFKTKKMIPEQDRL
jgi:hypothetical protein